MKEIELNALELVDILLNLSSEHRLCLLDSSGVGHLGSHLLIAGIEPIETGRLSNSEPKTSLDAFRDILSVPQRAVLFTISYEFGMKLNGIHSRHAASEEPDIFYAAFETLIVHDYSTGKTTITGNADEFDNIVQILSKAVDNRSTASSRHSEIRSNFTKSEYIKAVETIRSEIRAGNTYQTNLTMKLSADVENKYAGSIFADLRSKHPAPFAAYFDRGDSTVISASPERFIRISGDKIDTSPIKGTRRRGITHAEDEKLRAELLASEKDRAENTMIVDLLRNDLGRVCEFGSVRVEKLCELEEHPTLFHLVSTVSGTLRPSFNFADILPAVFPCGSITGAPKISTMKIIDRIEKDPRGISMGAVGININSENFSIPKGCDTSVAIRTIVLRDNVAEFNVGGGIVIDSDAYSEYNEALLKAKALVSAIGGTLQE